MCGITGIYAFNEVGRLFSVNLPASSQAIRHRGPDQDGIFYDYYCAMAHRRLSIIDLTEDGRQPMSDKTGRYTIVFNGEIYNYRQLRQKLEKVGCSFRSRSDTEVLLYMYIYFKEECLHQLHGFFSFAVYDKEENSLFIARDRMGIKPLVYYVDEDKFLFASEISALLAFNIPREIDNVSVFQYFQLNYIPAPHTIFKNVYKLLQGHYLKIQNKEIQIKQWYEPTYVPRRHLSKISYEDAKRELVHLLEQSVEERMIADVPLGTFLSGGIDSSTVTAIAARLTPHLNTFSIGYKDEPLFDETHYAELVAKQYDTNHTVFKLSTYDFFENIFELLKFYAEPFGDSSAIPTYILCKNTRQKVTVALSGDGGDEVFGGYQKYYGEYRARKGGLLETIIKTAYPVLSLLPKTRNSFLGNKIRQLYRFSESMYLSNKERYWYLCSWRKEEDAKKLFSSAILQAIDENEYNRRKTILTQHIQGDDINEVLYSDIKMLLPNDMLHKVDSMSMAVALEVRVPFLDYRIVDFAFQLPAEYKIDKRMKKKILQDAVKHLLPAELYNRPKQGFDIPLAKGYKTVLRPWIESLLEKDFICEQGYFDVQQTELLKKTIFTTNNFDQTQVWGFLAFQHWWKTWMR
ncbi:MAG: asparagine synthase (glutamine-hydrolyzing) [Cytophagales bacterium]|nr:asparagine synthase (glutamine-hydrolyzing) [Cytophagales bacterium]MDW8385061.1 asparagine synthase (glutamine-hydrolyzing) [Flammeovirgaceae bacterium]